MNFFLISGDGDGLSIARRIADEGHEITVQIRNKKAKFDFDNLLKKSDLSFLNSAPKDTIVIFDSTGGGVTAERLKAQGFPVIGASKFAQDLEMDRHLALDMMKDAGIQVPPSEHFMDWEAGRKHVEAKGERMVYKSDANSAISYVSTGPEDMIEFLKLQEQTQEDKPDFELQDFVKGLEISTEVWFDGVDFAPPINHTFEKKQLMNDDIGPSSGCAGNVVWACTEPYCRICEEGIKRFLPTLRYHNYRGMIDLNAIVNDDGVWGLEWTPRFGFDAFPAFMEMLTEGVGDVLFKYATGQRVVEFPMSTKGFAAGVRLTIPPYPFEHDNHVLAPKGVRISGLNRSDRAHSYFYNVFMDDQGVLRSSGGFGAIACFTGFGDTIYQALGKCEEICKRVEVKDKQYRTDLADKFEECYQKFRGMVGPKIPEPELPTISVANYSNDDVHEGQPVGAAMPGYDGQPRDGQLNRKV